MASQTEQKKTGLGDLPQELYDEVSTLSGLFGPR